MTFTRQTNPVRARGSTALFADAFRALELCLTFVANTAQRRVENFFSAGVTGITALFEKRTDFVFYFRPHFHTFYTEYTGQARV